MLAGALLVGAAGCVRWLAARRAARTRGCRRLAPERGHAGLALWSFMMATAHGAGLMLVPALVPLCMGERPGP